jgi:DNA-binding PadR family transcriptional regulator
MPGTNDPNLLVLVSLAAGPRHGHGILLDVRAFSAVTLGPGTLYGAIGRLEEDGLIEALEPDGRRRPYGLTPRGRSELERRLHGLDAAVQTGLHRLGTPS